MAFWRRLSRAVRPEEWRLVGPLIGLLAINTFVLEMGDVVATAGFISDVGTPQIIGLWVVDMVITVIGASAFALVVDRVERVKLVGWLLLIFAGLYGVLLALFMTAAPAWSTYPLLYILSDQQYVVFPLAFWALANDLFAHVETKRLFPTIAAGAAIGSLAGNGMAAAAGRFLPQTGTAGYQLLALSAVACLGGYLLLRVTLGRRTIRARQELNTPTMRESLTTGGDVVRNVPLFRYLALAMVGVGIAFTIIEYHFIVSLNALSAEDPLRLQAFYGGYKIGLVLMTLLVQWVISSRNLERASPKGAFIVLPIALVASAGLALAAPLIGGLAGRFVGRVVQAGWDEPARKTVQGLVPDERRGRVSVFLDSYSYAMATIAGCAVLGLLLGIQALGWVAPAALPFLYLGLSLVAAGSAVWATVRLRAVYEASLLNWRLARSRRRSVLDGIEF